MLRSWKTTCTRGMNTFENLSPSWSQTGKGSLAWSVVSLLTAPTAAGRLRVMVGAHPSGDAPAGHRPVGQRGHRRSTLRRVETPDVYEDHVPIAVFVPDVPGPARGFSPGHVKAPNRHGPTAANMVCCPSAVQMIPTNRLVWTFGDIFGFMLSEGTIVNMPARVSRDHAQVAAPIRRKIVKAPPGTWMRPAFTWMAVYGGGMPPEQTRLSVFGLARGHLYLIRRIQNPRH